MTNEDAKSRGIELEKRMEQTFSNEGWDCSRELFINRPFRFDVTLCKNEKIYGYIDCVICNNPHRIKRFFMEKARRVQSYLDEQKPEIFIITDGQTYEIYFDGHYAMTTTVPIGFEEYILMRNNPAYAKYFKEAE